MVILLVVVFKFLGGFEAVGIPRPVVLGVVIPLLSLALMAVWVAFRRFGSTPPPERQEKPPSTLPPPAWHPDPSGAQTQRYWDGRQWTASMQPPQQYGTGEIPPRNPTL
jgi:Protein of unknown function (DUF2510)